MRESPLGHGRQVSGRDSRPLKRLDSGVVGVAASAIRQSQVHMAGLLGIATACRLPPLRPGTATRRQSAARRIAYADPAETDRTGRPGAGSRAPPDRVLASARAPHHDARPACHRRRSRLPAPGCRCAAALRAICGKVHRAQPFDLAAPCIEIRRDLRLARIGHDFVLAVLLAPRRRSVVSVALVAIGLRRRRRTAPAAPAAC